MNEDYDNLIGYHIQNATYVWIGSSNINECRRFYLLDTYFLKDKKYYIPKYYFEDDNGKEYISDFFYDYTLKNPFLSLFGRCTSTSSASGNTGSTNTIFKNFFLAWNRYDLYLLLYTLREKGYSPELRIKIDDKIDYNVSTVKSIKAFFSVEEYNYKLLGTISDILVLYNDYLIHTESRFNNIFDNFLISSYSNQKDIIFNISRSIFLDAYIFGTLSTTIRDTTIRDSSTTATNPEGITGTVNSRKNISVHFFGDISVKIFDRLKYLLDVPEDNKIKQMIENSFFESNKNFKLNHPKYNLQTFFSGVMIFNKTLYAINLGDSKILLKTFKKVRHSKDFESFDSKMYAIGGEGGITPSESTPSEIRFLGNSGEDYFTEIPTIQSYHIGDVDRYFIIIVTSDFYKKYTLENMGDEDVVNSYENDKKDFSKEFFNSFDFDKNERVGIATIELNSMVAI